MVTRAQMVRKARKQVKKAKAEMDAYLDNAKLRADLTLCIGILKEISDDLPQPEGDHLTHRLALAWMARITLKQLEDPSWLEVSNG